MTRLEKATRAIELRDSGLKRAQIAERMGAKPGTVSAWLDDPDGSKLAARKRFYGRDCELCGKRTDGPSGAARAPSVCADCVTWTEDEVIGAIRRWANGHGGLPPTHTEWRSAQEGYPSASTVVSRYGWNRMLLAAGFDLRCDHIQRRRSVSKR